MSSLSVFFSRVEFRYDFCHKGYDVNLSRLRHPCWLVDALLASGEHELTRNNQGPLDQEDQYRSNPPRPVENPCKDKLEKKRLFAALDISNRRPGS
jgi:hypothetical protein